MAVQISIWNGILKWKSSTASLALQHFKDSCRLPVTDTELRSPDWGDSAASVQSRCDWHVDRHKPCLLCPALGNCKFSPSSAQEATPCRFMSKSD